MENVTMDRLFRVNKPVEVLGRNLIIRALSGPEMQERERAALLAGVNLDKRLRNPDSDDYGVVVSGFDDLEKPSLVAYLVASNLAKAKREAGENVPLHIPPFPENADDAEKMEVLERRQTLEAEHAVKVEAETKRLSEIYQLEIQEKSREWLLETCKRMARTNQVVQESNAEYVYYGLYLATYDENGKRYFANSTEARGLPNKITNLLLEYLDEVNKIDPLASNGQSSTE